MNSKFYISLSLRSPSGFENYGRYFLGNNREFAIELYTQLKGSSAEESSMMHMDFMEEINGIPVHVRTLSCNLEELGNNCKIIAKETFRIWNLEGDFTGLLS